FEGSQGDHGAATDGGAVAGCRHEHGAEAPAVADGAEGGDGGLSTQGVVVLAGNRDECIEGGHGARPAFAERPGRGLRDGRVTGYGALPAALHVVQLALPVRRGSSPAGAGPMQRGMAHMVIFRRPDGKPGYHQADGVDDAIRFVEMLRNQEKVTDARIFRMEEVPIEIRTYYKVEVAGEEPEPLAPVPPAVANALP